MRKLLFLLLLVASTASAQWTQYGVTINKDGTFNTPTGQLVGGAGVTERLDGGKIEYVWAGTIDHSILTGASTTQTVTLVTLPAGTVLEAAYVIGVERFDSPAEYDLFTLDLGRSDDTDSIAIECGESDQLAEGFVANVPVICTTGGPGVDLPRTNSISSATNGALGAAPLRYTQANPIVASFYSPLSNLNTYTSGKVKIIILYSILPEN